MPTWTPKLAAPRVVQRAGAPYSWFYCSTPAPTFKSDAGDVSDLMGRTAAGLRSGAASFADGPRGKLIRCPGGGGDYARLVASAFDFDAFTVSLRFAIDPAAGGGGLFQWAADSPAYNNPYLLATYDGSTLRTYCADGYRSTIPITPGGWHAYDATCDGIGWAFYLDGVRVGTYSASAPAEDYIRQRAAAIYLGNGFPSSLACLIDEFRLYRRVLGPMEVARNYADPDWRLRAEDPVALLTTAAGPPTFRPWWAANVNQIIGSGVY